MTPEEVRAIIREEFANFIKSDRFTFEKLIQILDGRNIQLGLDNGTMLGTAATQKLAFFGATPVVQPNDTGETSTAAAGGGAAIRVDTTFNGGLGGTAYTVTDISKALKQVGILE